MRKFPVVVLLFLLTVVFHRTASATATVDIAVGSATTIPLNTHSSLSGMCDDANGATYDLGCVVSGGYATYNLSVQQAGTYNMTLNYASPVGGTSAAILVNGVKAASVAFANTNGWGNYVNAAPVAVILPAGQVSFTVLAQNSGFNLDGVMLTPAIPTITASGSTPIPLQGYTAISGMCPDANGATFDLGCVQANGYATYALNVTQAGNYTVTATYASPTNDSAAYLLVNGSVAASVSFPNTGTWSNYINASPVTVTLPAGPVTFKVQAQSAGFNLAGLAFASATSAAPITPSPTTTTLPEPTPIAWWKFDQNSGTSAADSIGGSTGALLNGASWTSGASGNAIAVGSPYYGGGGAVSLPVSLPPTFTLSFWAKANGYSNATNIENNVVLGGGTYQTNGFRAGFNSEGVFTFWTTESGGTLQLSDIQAAPVGTWNQFVISYQNGTAALYRNGTLVSTANGTYVPGATSIGIDTGVGGVNTFWGAVDDLRVFNVALPGTLTNNFGTFGSSQNQVIATYTPKFDDGTVPASYFGMTVHSLGQPNIAGATNTTPFPPFSIATLRLWDVAYWQQIEPSSGQFNWTNMDKTILSGTQNGTTDFIFTLGHVPAWASSKPTDYTCSEGPGSCDYPTMAAFDDFLTHVVQRYCGTVKYYEAWNEPDNYTFWNGTNQQLLEIASHVYSIVKSPANCAIGGVNPNQVLLPPVSSTGLQSLSWLDSFLAVAGSKYPYADITAFHGYGYDNSPEGITQGVAAFKQVVQRYGLGNLPIWNTEANWGTRNAYVSQDQDAAWLMRYYLAQAGTGVSRFVWYAYDNCAWGPLWGSSCDASNKPLDSWSGIRQAGLSFGVLEQWIVGKTVSECDRYQNGLWSCRVQGASGYNGWIVWSTSGSLPVTVPSGMTDYRDYLNNTHSVPAALTVSSLPLLLEN
ncbi:LamG-like jellyroll fold domain-containing protein [Terriglobus roseus]|uniref:LamG-like jellyroll fold domain-containing protein n=1 Tax=Terriglobus roseus TaxID=392734 RepID=UPI00147A7BE7|nr:LamG-like jellyroll fold domain-containing protein [Terriglobus roseus]